MVSKRVEDRVSKAQALISRTVEGIRNDLTFGMLSVGEVALHLLEKQESVTTADLTAELERRLGETKNDMARARLEAGIARLRGESPVKPK